MQLYVGLLIMMERGKGVEQTIFGYAVVCKKAQFSQTIRLSDEKSSSPIYRLC
jgi:hypothetical protein